MLSLDLLLFLLVFRNIPYVSFTFFVYFADYNTSFKVYLDFKSYEVYFYY